MNKKNLLRNRKGVALLATVCLLLCATIGGTVAWLVAQTNQVVNEFEPGRVPPVITETVAGNEKSDIRVTNSGNVDAFLRVAVVMNWVNASGQYVAEELPALPTGLGNGWERHTDGYYYYTEEVAPGGTTNQLFTTAIAEPINGPAGCHLEVAILAESVQAKGVTGSMKAVEDAWGIDPSTLGTSSEGGG